MNGATVTPKKILINKKNKEVIMQTNKPKVLITDFDRTMTYLYKDTNLLIELADKMVAFYSGTIDIPQKYRERNTDGYFVWHNLHEIVVDKLPHNISDEINKKADEVVADFELQIIKRIGLFSGIVESINSLSKLGIRLGIVSSNATITVTYPLKKTGIFDKFEYIEGRPYPFNPDLIKPNPYPINKAVSAMNASEISTWYVGDDIIDIIAANAANVTSVGVCTGRHSKEELLEAGADLIFNSFNDIVKCFD
jgi:phosphoglycolate phosphatase-like HAD superfamily hydrolase